MGQLRPNRTLLPLVLGLTVWSGCADPIPQAPPITSTLEFTWRHSLMVGGTGVLRIRNHSSEPMSAVHLHYENQDSGQTQDYSVGSIAPFNTVEVGVLESGWMIEPNEVVIVSSDGYQPQSLYFYNDRAGRMIMTHGYAAKKGQQLGDLIHSLLK